jgi:hypothetical protein
MCDMISRLEDFQLRFIEQKNSQLFGNNQIIESITESDFLGISDMTIINNVDNSNNNSNSNSNNTIDINDNNKNDMIVNDIGNIDEDNNNNNDNHIIESDIVNIDEDNKNNNDTINSSFEQTYGIFDENRMSLIMLMM